MRFFYPGHHRFNRDDGPPDDHRGRHDHRASEGFHRFGRRGERGRGGGGRSELGRFFAHGDLRLVILQLIAEKPRHGYEIIKAIEDRVGGAYSPSPGVVYPTLTMLEDLGHVSVTPGEGTKKLHEITPEGRAVLEGSRPILEALLARMAQAADTFGGGPHPSIVRAREGLKLALHLRLARGALTDEQSAAIAAALEAATAAVERS